MHRKYGQDGLVTVSVSLDDPDDKDSRGNIKKLLEKQKAAFPNYWLLEESGVWSSKLKISGPPCVYVFNRDNQWVAKYDKLEESDQADIEQRVRDLLKQ
jgi:hypothetical protein